MEIVSKELFEAVYGKTLEELNLDLDDLKYVNIEGFYFKCKEWAYSQGYMMKIENHYPNSIRIQIRKPIPNSMYKEPWKRTFKNEVEAMIEVCEWILNHKKKGV